MEKVLGDKSALYDAVISALSSLATIEEIETRMEGKPVGEAPEPIDELLIDAIERVKASAKALKSAKAALESLGAKGDAPEPIDTELLSGVLAVKASAKGRKECKERLTECDKTLEEIQNEIKQYGNEINICPVCGAVLVDGRCSE